MGILIRHIMSLLDQVLDIKEFDSNFCCKPVFVSAVQLSHVMGVRIDLTKTEVYSDKTGRMNCTLNVP